MEDAAENDDDASLEHSIVSHYCIEGEGPQEEVANLYDEDNDGILGVVFGWVGPLENASLTGCSDGHGGCRLRE